MSRLTSFIFLVLVACSQSFLFDDGSLQNLLNLITQEKKSRAVIERDIDNLKKEIAALRSTHQSSLCKCPASGVVAFSATITNDISNFGTNQPIVFDQVITNVGGAYDARHGSFRAPVDGVYMFSLSILQGQATMWLGVELVRNDEVIGRVKTGDNGYYNMGSNVINVRLHAGDDVWIRHMNDNDNKNIVADKGLFTSFSGHLIKAD